HAAMSARAAAAACGPLMDGFPRQLARAVVGEISYGSLQNTGDVRCTPPVAFAQLNLAYLSRIGNTVSAVAGGIGRMARVTPLSGRPFSASPSGGAAKNMPRLTDFGSRPCFLQAAW